MKQLYLIRRNLETFVGPMAPSEIKAGYKRLAFGPDDEVAGHCGPWVAFASSELMKRHYPEIAKIISEENATWVRSDQVGVHKERSSRAVRVSRPEKRARPWLAFAFLTIACAAAFAAFELARSAHFGGRILQHAADGELSLAASYVEKNDMVGFTGFMADHIGALVPHLIKSKTIYQAWMPYLRLYAFSEDGEVAGLPARLLRGSGTVAAPLDCSVRSWQKRWHASSDAWSSFVSGQKMPRAPWAQILAWDPYWVSRRHGSGWIRPQSYYEACLAMALKGLDDPSLASDIKIQSAKASLHRRLEWLLDGSVETSAGKSADALDVLTCMESAGNAAALLACRDTQLGADPWRQYLDDRLALNQARLLLAPGHPLTTAQLAELNTLGQRFAHGDAYTGCDWQPEVRLWREFALGGDVYERLQNDYPDIDLRHWTLGDSPSPSTGR